MDKSDIERLLTPEEVAQWLGIEVETLNVWRATNRYDLAYIKVGRLVRYPIGSVQKFLDSRLHGGTI